MGGEIGEAVSGMHDEWILARVDKDVTRSYVLFCTIHSLLRH